MYALDKLVGKRLSEVKIPANDTYLYIECQDDSWIRLRAEGECCSQSWIEHLELPPDIVGALVLSITNGADAAPFDGHVCTGGCGHDSLAVYNTTIHTDRGDVVIEYRNNSNGYYGGSLELEDEDIK